MENKIKIACVTGRSGGHIIPCLTLAKNNPNTTVVFFSTNTTLDHQLLAQKVDRHIPLTLGKVPYKKWWLFPVFAWQLAASFFTSLYHLYQHKPAKMISTGGYIAIPVCLAAKLLRIPIELYELNATPGKAVKFLAPLANKLFVCFEQTKKHFKKPCIRTSYPVKFSESEKLSQTQALKKLGFTPEKKTLLILGGSQGSVWLNTAIKLWLRKSRHLYGTLQIIHQTGCSDPTDWQEIYNILHIPAHIFSYHDQLNLFYSAADLIVCRAGAGTLFEAAFFAKKAIVIPLKASTTSHQIDNARAIAEEYPELFTVVQQDQEQFFALLDEKIAPSKEFLHRQGQEKPLE